MNDTGKALSDWLQASPWDIFFTITTRKPRRDSLAFIRDIKGNLEQGNQCSKLFIACEPYRFNRNLHAHGLLLFGGQVDSGGRYFSRDVSYDLWDDLFRKFGRSRVEHIVSRRQVVNYCVKYVTKLTDGDSWNYFETQ